MSNKLKPGNVFDVDCDKIGRKDAFHVPCVLVTTDDSSIQPGNDVKFNDDFTKVESCSRGERQAIVDPFLDYNENIDQAFWVMIIPNLVSDLSHSFDIGNSRTQKDKDEDAMDLPEYFLGKGYEFEEDQCAGC